MKIITTIGTSLVTNVINPLRNRDDLTKEEKEVFDSFQILQQKDYSQKEDMLNEYKILRDFILRKATFDERASAEIKSIINIKKNYPNSFLEIEPIATDTILSPLCSEVLKELIEKNLDDIRVNLSENNIIEDLQVGDYKRYKKGLINLLNRLNQFAYNGKYFDDLILNITGGFKGVIPYLTIYGQVNNIPLFYIFEFTSALIEIPQIPITIDKDIFIKEWKTFYELDKNEILNREDLEYEFIKQYKNLLEIEEELVSFNALGKILWDNYKRENLIFHTTDNVFKEISRLPNIKNILKSKFQFNYQEKTEQKNSHYVYDDGNNPYRIFYFIEDKHFYIYKVFENHDTYEKYINTSFDKKSFKREIELFKI
jgi:putative CRISPR-associated protein (TIGR02619 family)